MQIAPALLLLLCVLQLGAIRGWLTTQSRQRLQPVNLAKKRSIVNRQRKNDAAPATDNNSVVIPVVNNDDYRFKIVKNKEEKNDDTIPTQLLTDCRESKKGLTTLLEDDIKELSQKSLKIDSPVSSGNDSPLSGVLNAVKDAVSLILIVDFFVIIFFLGWFILAAVLKDSNPFFLERFQDLFNPVVQPAIGILMAGSIASGLLGDRKKEEN